MTNIKRLSNGLLVALVAITCLYSHTNAAAEAGAEPKVMKLTPVDRYVLDFSESEDGGVPGGNFDNFAFNLDLREPVRKISVRRGEQGKDVIASYDYADCTRGQESLLQKPLSELAAGNATWVDYVDIEMIPLLQKNVEWAGGVCYGYRNPSGAWHWHLAATPLTYDPATDRVRARIWVKEANIDALKLVFDYSVPRQSVRSVTLTTRSANATSDK
jgi:hypothetical protein